MKRYLWVVGLVVLIGAFAFFYFQGQAQNSNEELVEESLKTSKVRKGDITITASGVGAIIAPADIQVGFSTAGVIEEISVQTGDQVKKGDILARLIDDPQLNLDIATQQIAVINEQTNFDELLNNLDADTASASINYLQAKSDLEKLLTDRSSLNYRRCDDTYLVQYETDYSNALDNLTRLQDRFNLLYASRDPGDPERLQLEAEISVAQSKVNTTLANYQYCSSYPTQDEIDLIEAKIKLKETDVLRWKNEIEILQQGVDPQDLELFEARLAQAIAKLRIAEENLNGLVLTAPIDGTVMKVSAIPGQSISNNTPVIRIADLSKPILEVYLDETDLDQLVIGYEAEVIFDAFDDTVFKGKVISLTPELIKNGNVFYVHGLVELDPTSFGKPFNLPIGLNASVDIIGGRSLNTLLVPVEALRPVGDGSYAVFVLENGTPKLRMVEVGLTDFTTAEILSGLKIGEEVTTGIVETVQ